MLSIGQVAEQASVSTSAIRFYERKGLLPAPERESGRRRYDENAVRRLQVIDIAKRAGFTLDEIRAVTDDEAAGTAPAGALRELADRKLEDVDALIARAQAMRAWLLRARECDCSSLDLCDLFARPEQQPASRARPPTP